MSFADVLLTSISFYLRAFQACSNLVCGPMLSTAVQDLSFFCNIYIHIYIINSNEIYIYECIYCRKKISLVLPCKASAHKPSEHIHHLCFFFLNIYIYIFHCYFIIYTNVYTTKTKPKQIKNR